MSTRPISALYWGQPKTGKTTAALSAPGPKHVFDFDVGVDELTDEVQLREDPPWKRLASDVRYRDYEGETVYVHPMTFSDFILEPTHAQREALLKKFEDRFKAMLRQDIPCQTIIVDTDSQWWKLVADVKREQSLRQAQARGSKRTEPNRLDYGLANAYRENTILAAKQAGVNFILIERAKELWGTDEEGKNPQGTGVFVPKGNADTVALVAITVEFFKQQTQDKATGKTVTKYAGRITDSRFKGLEGMVIPDLDHGKLLRLIEASLKRKEKPAA